MSHERNFKKHKLGDKLWQSLYINIDGGLIEHSDSVKVKPLNLCRPSDGL